mgnify:CR=1 FL=1
MKASEVLDNLKRRFPNEPEYHQAVSEVLGTIEEVYNEHPEFEKSNLIERLCIPDRIFSFRVTWMDDKGQIQTVSSITMRSARTKVVSVFTLL